MIETATASVEHTVDQSTGAWTDNLAQAVSFFAKAGERSWVFVRTTNKASRVDTSYVNISTGATGTVDANHTVRTTACVNGWYRVQVILDSAQTGGTTPKVEIGLTTGDGVTSYTGSTSDGLYLWGFQHEKDVGVESSYIPTTTGSVARSADTLV